MLSFANSPLVVAEACYCLFEEQIKEKGVSQEQFEEMLGPDEIAELRHEVIEQMKGFSSFWSILSTEMEKLQSGDINLEKLADAAAARAAAPTGPSS